MTVGVSSRAAPGSMVTRRGHLQYGDLLLGPGTPYRWQTTAGWADLPALDSGTVMRAGGHGALPGRLLAQSRTVELDGLIIRTPRAAIGAAVDALEAGTGIVEDELPLVYWRDERGPRMVWARCVRRLIPDGPGYNVGTITGCALEFEASDPRRYALLEQSAAAGLPMPEAGLDWHADAGEALGWPLLFGEPGSTGALSASNAGHAPTHPVVMFRGPVVRPALTCITSGDVLEYDLELSGSDVLVVDTRDGTVTLNGTASRKYSATARSAPEELFMLPPGTSDYTFRAAPGSNDPAASVTVQWRAAFW